MNLNTMTTSERERLAYAEGFVETAKMFARLDDMHRAMGAEVADYELMRAERDQARAQAKQLEDIEGDRDATRDDLMQSEHRAGQLTAELDSLHAEYCEACDQRDSAREERDAYYDDYRLMRAERDAARVAVKMAIDLLEDPDAGADEATAVLAYLRDVW